jgi:hypothetical protein
LIARRALAPRPSQAVTNTNTITATDVNLTIVDATNSGSISVGGRSTLVMSGSLANSGTITANGDSFTVAGGTVSSGGSIVINSGCATTADRTPDLHLPQPCPRLAACRPN